MSRPLSSTPQGGSLQRYMFQTAHQKPTTDPRDPPGTAQDPPRNPRDTHGPPRDPQGPLRDTQGPQGPRPGIHRALETPRDTSGTIQDLRTPNLYLPHTTPWSTNSLICQRRPNQLTPSLAMIFASTNHLHRSTPSPHISPLRSIIIPPCVVPQDEYPREPSISMFCIIVLPS